MSKGNKKVQMAAWSDLHFEVSVNRCPNNKCGHFMDRVPAMGVLSLNVCRKCKKFYALKIENVTSELTRDFKKKILSNEKRG